jgi:hypothetical protein
MRSISILLFSLLLSLHKNYSQILVIDELNVSHFIIKKDPKIHVEGESDGPFVRITFTIINDSSEVIFIDTDSNNLSLSYGYNNEKFEEEMIWELVEGQEKLEIKSSCSKTFTTSTFMFLGTKIWKENKYDYTIELLKVLPTFKLIYNDKQLKLVSNNINNVIINE